MCTREIIIKCVMMSCHMTSVRMLSFRKCYIWKVPEVNKKLTNQIALWRNVKFRFLLSPLARTLLKRRGDVGDIFVLLLAQHDVLCCDLNLFVVHHHHVHAQQIFVLQKEASSTFCNMKVCWVRRWSYTQQILKLQRNSCYATICTKMLPILLGL